MFLRCHQFAITWLQSLACCYKTNIALAVDRDCFAYFMCLQMRWCKASQITQKSTTNALAHWSTIPQHKTWCLRNIRLIGEIDDLMCLKWPWIYFHQIYSIYPSIEWLRVPACGHNFICNYNRVVCVYPSHKCHTSFWDDLNPNI